MPEKSLNTEKVLEEEGISLPVYRMSNAGACQRAIAAPRLGYDPTPENEGSRVLLEEATEDETRVKRRLAKTGLDLASKHGLGLTACPKCLAEFGSERFGIHVELGTSTIRLIGHLDDKVYFNNEIYPVEIKNLGKLTWEKFRRNQFMDFPEYEAQEALYLAATDSPGGIYAVRCRDNGKMLVYAVGELPIEIIAKLKQVETSEFGMIPKPEAGKILDKLNLIELYVQGNELPPAEYKTGNSQCWWCKFKYLCHEEKIDKEVKEETLSNLLEAADLWQQGKALESQAKGWVESAKQVFLSHAKTNKISKYKVGMVSVSYNGTRTKRYVDEVLLKELVAKEVIDKVYKETNAWDDIRIRTIKGE